MPTKRQFNEETHPTNPRDYKEFEEFESFINVSFSEHLANWYPYYLVFQAGIGVGELRGVAELRDKLFPKEEKDA